MTLSTKLSMPGYWPFNSWPTYSLLGWHWPVWLLETKKCRVYLLAAEDRSYSVVFENRIFAVENNYRGHKVSFNDRAFTLGASDRFYKVDYCG